MIIKRRRVKSTGIKRREFNAIKIINEVIKDTTGYGLTCDKKEGKMKRRRQQKRRKSGSLT